jgi:hypothetical protein
VLVRCGGLGGCIQLATLLTCNCTLSYSEIANAINPSTLRLKPHCVITPQILYLLQVVVLMAEVKKAQLRHRSASQQQKGGKGGGSGGAKKGEGKKRD